MLNYQNSAVNKLGTAFLCRALTSHTSLRPMKAFLNHHRIAIAIGRASYHRMTPF
ncbi:hypothetical protein [Scytonema sp. NUACC21]